MQAERSYGSMRGQERWKDAMGKIGGEHFETGERDTIEKGEGGGCVENEDECKEAGGQPETVAEKLGRIALVEWK